MRSNKSKMYGVTPIVAVIEANGTMSVALSLRSRNVNFSIVLINFIS